MSTTKTTDKKIFLAAAEMADLEGFVRERGESPFRARQIREWIVKRRTVDPMEMTNLSAALRAALKESFLCGSLSVAETEEAPDGTKKYLLRLHDGETVECASIPAEDGRLTFCLSSQVGCPVGCVFCTSGAHGLVRNLHAGEIVEEFFLLSKREGKMPDNVVMMGVGEPLLNYANLERALDIITDPDGVGLAQRRVTISTSGWTPGIFQLAKHGKQWNLAVSLHAPDDKIRSRLIPDAFRKTIREILQACKAHRDATGRLLTLEYVLLAGINDTMQNARDFAEVALQARAKVNLIPYNKARGSFERPDRETVKRFENVLISRHVPVTVRVEKGSAGSAACGQLRASFRENNREKQEVSQ
ncbi:MAG: 23S rRNA (adenine(2503)-C(2))-methyltransferase RlmN [Lentisphaeria bacterium]|nr:23S rRNA (adenine(2503)-C(2))-methyltransferase RlmN [Lentisphaeria bacterium]